MQDLGPTVLEYNASSWILIKKGITVYCLSCCPTAVFQYLLDLFFMLSLGFEIHYVNLNVSTALLQMLLYLDFMIFV